MPLDRHLAPAPGQCHVESRGTRLDTDLFHQEQCSSAYQTDRHTERPRPPTYFCAISAQMMASYSALKLGVQYSHFRKWGDRCTPCTSYNDVYGSKDCPVKSRSVTPRFCFCACAILRIPLSRLFFDFFRVPPIAYSQDACTDVRPRHKENIKRRGFA